MKFIVCGAYITTSTGKVTGWLQGAGIIDKECKEIHTHIILMNKRKEYFCIEIYTEAGICPSGWTTCREGYSRIYAWHSLVEVDLVPIDEGIISLPAEWFKSYSYLPNDVDNYLFCFSENGDGGHWYPNGKAKLRKNMWRNREAGEVLPQCTFDVDDVDTDDDVSLPAFESDSDETFEEEIHPLEVPKVVLEAPKEEPKEYTIFGGTKLHKNNEALFQIYYTYKNKQYVVNEKWESVEVSYVPCLTSRYCGTNPVTYRQLLLEGTNEDNFQHVKGFTQRPLWIVTGSSNLGKSYLSAYFARDDLQVYETDSSPTLPTTEQLENVDVFVTGKYTLEEVRHLFSANRKYITVTFADF